MNTCDTSSDPNVLAYISVAVFLRGNPKAWGEWITERVDFSSDLSVSASDARLAKGFQGRDAK